MAINFLLKRSNTASKRPTAAQLDIGELSLNYEQNTAGVFFEDSNGDVRKVGPVEVSASAPNSSPAGSSGNSLGELWYDTGTSNLKVWTGASFVSATSSVAAGGSDTQVQFNSTGSLAGSSNLTFDGTTLTAAGLSVTGNTTLGDAAADDITLTGSIASSVVLKADSTYNLGEDLVRWANIYADNVYSGDLHLKNDRGDYTLIEEEDALTIRNNKTGKVYNIVMTEREV